ncbi:MAG: hypothetical protein K2Y37_01305 [Pirellulales bacterium]|nr:hypothetical protein [Pirellulales bacterium]
MQPFSVHRSNPNRSAEMHKTLLFVQRRLCRTMKNQKVVGRRDWNGRKVSQADFDAGDRSAHVCPFVQDALDRDFLWLEESNKSTQSDVEALLQNQVDLFIHTPPVHDPVATQLPAKTPDLWKAFITIFPFLPLDSNLIRSIHLTLKPQFVAKGLMIGEFFPGFTGQKGIHNDVDFFPGIAPYPLFAIRYMVESDRLFNRDPLYDAHYRRYFP